MRKHVLGLWLVAYLGSLGLFVGDYASACYGKNVTIYFLTMFFFAILAGIYCLDCMKKH